MASSSRKSYYENKVRYIKAMTAVVSDPFESFDQFFEEMGPENAEEVFNSYFLYDGSRPGFAITHKIDPQNIVKKISKYFNFSYYKVGHFLLVTTKNRSLKFDPKTYTDEDIGKFLGYPCVADFSTKRDYVFSIGVVDKPNDWVSENASEHKPYDRVSENASEHKPNDRVSESANEHKPYDKVYENDNPAGVYYELIGMICGQPINNPMGLFKEKIFKTIGKINQHTKLHKFDARAKSIPILKTSEVVKAVNEGNLTYEIKAEVANWLFNYDPQRLFDPSRQQLLKDLVADMAVSMDEIEASTMSGK
jgi:hypothetical protein